jgi:tetratricopeptide (TPR) repeat protein
MRVRQCEQGGKCQANPEPWKSRLADDKLDCQATGNERGIAACSRILADDPGNFYALANRGITHRVIGDYQRALADLNTALQINPNCHGGFYLERGLALDGNGDHRAAVMDFDEALKRDSTLIQAYFGRAMSLQAIGRHDLAEVDLREALRRDPIIVAAFYVERGYALTKSRNFGGAIAAFDQAINISPDWISAYFGRGAAHERNGDRDHALADYRRALDFSAKNQLEIERQQFARERIEKMEGVGGAKD